MLVQRRFSKTGCEPALIIREPPTLFEKAASHQVQPTEPQDILNKEKQYTILRSFLKQLPTTKFVWLNLWTIWTKENKYATRSLSSKRGARRVRLLSIFQP